MTTYDDAAPAQAVVGRQAIQDRTGATVGYELLFRASETADSAGSAHDAAEMTTQVALSSVAIGLDVVTEGGQAFCNVDDAVLTGDSAVLFPASDQVVLEVPAGVGADAGLLAGCRRLVEEGYALALDDYAGLAADEELLRLVGVVKIDVGRRSADEVRALAARGRAHGARLLAQRVETQEQYTAAYDLGFHLFQGYFINRPVVVTGQALEPEGLSRMKMAVLMLKSDLDVAEVVDLLHTDPALAVRVLKLASMGRPGQTKRKVASIREAVVLTGTRTIQNWMSAILLRPARSEGSSRYLDVLVRARAVENLAVAAGLGPRDVAFAAGMLSALDLQLSMSTDQLRAFLSVDDTLGLAAFGEPGTGARTTPLARLVGAATDYQLGAERGEVVEDASQDAVVSSDELEAAFGDAFTWATTAVQELGSSQQRTA